MNIIKIDKDTLEQTTEQKSIIKREYVEKMKEHHQNEIERLDEFLEKLDEKD